MRDLERIERFERAGVHRGVFWLPSRGPDDVEAAMDRCVQTAQEFERAGG